METKMISELPAVSEIPDSAHVLVESNGAAKRVPVSAFQTGENENSKPWLMGPTTSITPSQVADALAAEQNVLLSHTDETYGVVTFSYFFVSGAFGTIIGSAIFMINDETVAGTLVGSIENSTWTLRVTPLALASDIPDIPTTLPNPNKLTFDGAVTGSYDGSAAVSITIPTAHTPVKGVDYWTDEDQASMVEQVIAALPDASEVSY